MGETLNRNSFSLLLFQKIQFCDSNYFKNGLRSNTRTVPSPEVDAMH